MNVRPLTITHPWNLSPREAVALQKQLSAMVIRTSGITINDVATVAGVDTHYRSGLATAAVVTMKFPDLETVDYATAVRRVDFPYIPGLLSFREAPVVLDRYANTASAGSLIAFHLHNRDLAEGDLGVICSFGAGYSIGSLVVRKR